MTNIDIGVRTLPTDSIPDLVTTFKSINYILQNSIVLIEKNCSAYICLHFTHNNVLLNAELQFIKRVYCVLQNSIKRTPHKFLPFNTFWVIFKDYLGLCLCMCVCLSRRFQSDSQIFCPTFWTGVYVPSTSSSATKIGKSKLRNYADHKCFPILRIFLKKIFIGKYKW